MYYSSYLHSQGGAVDVPESPIRSLSLEDLFLHSLDCLTELCH